MVTVGETRETDVNKQHWVYAIVFNCRRFLNICRMGRGVEGWGGGVAAYRDIELLLVAK